MYYKYYNIIIFIYLYDFIKSYKLVPENIITHIAVNIWNIKIIKLYISHILSQDGAQLI